MKAFERIKSFAEYVGDVTRLRARRILRASDYEGPFFQESDLRDCAGISVASTRWDSVWLAVDKLKSTEPPAPPADIAGWMKTGDDPDIEPSKLGYITVNLPPEDAELFVASGRVAADDVKSPPEDEAGEDGEKPSAQVILRLSAFPELGAKVDDFIEGPWRDWAGQEQQHRRAISVYGQIVGFADAARAGAEAEPIELVWGLGGLRWDHPKLGPIDHPVIEVPLDVDKEKMSERLALRPRWQEARLAESLFDALPGEGPAKFLESESNRIAELIESGEKITPFRRESFESILRRCAEQIDIQGLYRPDGSSLSDGRQVPPEPVVSDGWEVYARPAVERPVEDSAGAKPAAAVAATQSPAEPDPAPEPSAEPPAKDEELGGEPETVAAEPGAESEPEEKPVYEASLDAAPNKEPEAEAALEAEDKPPTEETAEEEPAPDAEPKLEASKTNGKDEDASREEKRKEEEAPPTRSLPQISLSLAGPAAKSGLNKIAWRPTAIAALLVAAAGVGYYIYSTMPSKEERAEQRQQDTLAAVQESQPSSLSPRGELADYFNLTSRHTADQRADKEEAIKGEIVEWDLPVQSWSKQEDGTYRVQTSAFMDTVGTTVTLHARNDAEREYVESLDTGDWIRIKGKIQGVASYDVEIIDAIPISN